jgi:hypothetical protein
MERSMKRTARIVFATALLMGGAPLAVAQNSPPTGGYAPVRWNAYYNYYAWPYCAPSYYLAPYYYPGDYPGAPAYRYLSWVCWPY